MASTLPDPIDTSHLAPCARCGTLNGISASWCWRCDAALAADAAPPPRSMPAVVYDPRFAGDPPQAIARPPGWPVLDEAGWLVDASPAAPFDPPLLTQRVDAIEAQPVADNEAGAGTNTSIKAAAPVPAAPGRSARNWRLGLLVLAAFVVAGVAAYVQVREAARPDLDRPPPPSAGPAAQPEPQPPSQPTAQPMPQTLPPPSAGPPSQPTAQPMPQTMPQPTSQPMPQPTAQAMSQTMPQPLPIPRQIAQPRLTGPAVRLKAPQRAAVDPAAARLASAQVAPASRAKQVAPASRATRVAARQRPPRAAALPTPRAAVKAPSAAPAQPKARARGVGDRAPTASQSTAAARIPAPPRATSAYGAAAPAPASTARRASRTPAYTEPSRVAPARSAPPAAQPAPRRVAGPCTPNAAALGLCTPD